MRACLYCRCVYIDMYVWWVSNRGANITPAALLLACERAAQGSSGVLYLCMRVARVRVQAQ